MYSGSNRSCASTNFKWRSRNFFNQSNCSMLQIWTFYRCARSDGTTVLKTRYCNHQLDHMITHRLVQELNQMVTATSTPNTPVTPTKQHITIRGDRGHSPPPAGKMLTHTPLAAIITCYSINLWRITTK